MVILDKWLILKDGCVMNTDTGEIHWFKRDLYREHRKENPIHNG